MADLNSRFRQNLGIQTAYGEAYKTKMVYAEIERWIQERGGTGTPFSISHRKGSSRELILKCGETEGYGVVGEYIHLDMQEFNQAGKGPDGENKQLELIAKAIEAGIEKVGREIAQGPNQDNERLVRVRGHLKSLLA